MNNLSPKIRTKKNVERKGKYITLGGFKNMFWFNHSFAAKFGASFFRDKKVLKSSFIQNYYDKVILFILYKFYLPKCTLQSLSIRHVS